MVEKIETPFHRFVLLARFDREVQYKAREIKAAEAMLVERRAQVEQTAALLQTARDRLHQLKKDKVVAEHDLVGMQQELERKKMRLEKTSEAREYTALLHEIELLSAQYKAKEEIFLELWQQLEEAEPKLAQFEAGQAPLLAEQRKQLELVEGRIVQLRSEFDLLKSQREEKVHGILPEWLNLYETMRRQVEDPAALMEKNLCSGCGSIVPPANQIAARHHQLVVCQQCRRLLYTED